MNHSKTQMMLAAASVALLKQNFVEGLVLTNCRGDPCGCTTNPDELGYFCGDTYEAQSHSDKLDQLWTQCLKDYQVQPVPYEGIGEMFRDSANKSFRWESDELPKDRPKIAHAQGVVAKVRWIPSDDSPFTGLYRETSEALLRLSEGGFDLPEITGLNPSLAMKFTRDGMKSVNMLANVAFEQSNSFNFFKNDFRVNIDMFSNECAQKTIRETFLEQNTWINNLGLSEFAWFTQEGLSSQVEEETLHFPFDLWFEYAGPATTTLWPNWHDYSQRQLDENGDEVKFYTQLQDIPVQSVLFNVMARETALSHKGTQIATIVTETPFYTSAFGD